MDITFVVAIYNVGEYLDECISSILKNPGNNYEVLLIDDGSTDNSPEICDKYGDSDNRVHVYHKKNGGVSSARNLGIEKAKGKWICFVDGDDTVTNEVTGRVLESIKTGADIVYLGFDHLIDGKIVLNNPDMKDTLILKGNEILGIRNSILNFDSDKYKHFHNTFNYNTPWAKLYNTEFLKKYDYGYTLNIFRSQDSLFNYRVLANVHQIQFVPIVGYHYRIISTSVSNKFNPKMHELNLLTLAEYDKIIKEEKNDAAYPYFYTLCMKQLLYACKLCFCHINNKKSYKERKRDFLNAKNTSYYALGYKYGDIDTFRTYIKPMAFAAKHNWFLAIEIMAKLSQKVRKK